MHVEYINLSMGAIGINGHKALNESMENLSTNKQEQLYLEKIITICIPYTYFVFCKRDRDWTSPELLTF